MTLKRRVLNFNSSDEEENCGEIEPEECGQDHQDENPAVTVLTVDLTEPDTSTKPSTDAEDGNFN